MEIIYKILNDNEFNKLQVPYISPQFADHGFMKLVKIKGFVNNDLDVLYIPNYYYAAYLLAIEQN